jgi:hypothetical protein
MVFPRFTSNWPQFWFRIGSTTMMITRICKHHCCYSCKSCMSKCWLCCKLWCYYSWNYYLLSTHILLLAWGSYSSWDSWSLHCTPWSGYGRAWEVGIIVLLVQSVNTTTLLTPEGLVPTHVCTVCRVTTTWWCCALAKLRTSRVVPTTTQTPASIVDIPKVRNRVNPTDRVIANFISL